MQRLSSEAEILFAIDQSLTYLTLKRVDQSFAKGCFDEIVEEVIADLQSKKEENSQDNY